MEAALKIVDDILDEAEDDANGLADRLGHYGFVVHKLTFQDNLKRNFFKDKSRTKN